MTAITYRSIEGFASFDAEVPSMHVSNRGEALDHRLHVVRLDHDHKVDHGLGGETRDGGGADVLDRDREVAD
jgi:hypothetical protein